MTRTMYTEQIPEVNEFQGVDIHHINEYLDGVIDLHTIKASGAWEDLKELVELAVSDGVLDRAEQTRRDQAKADELASSQLCN